MTAGCDAGPVEMLPAFCFRKPGGQPPAVKGTRSIQRLRRWGRGQLGSRDSPPDCSACCAAARSQILCQSVATNSSESADAAGVGGVGPPVIVLAPSPSSPSSRMCCHVVVNGWCACVGRC